MSDIILKVKNLTRTYIEDKVSTAVLKGINLEIEEGKITAITGKSGKKNFFLGPQCTGWKEKGSNY